MTVVVRIAIQHDVCVCAGRKDQGLGIGGIGARLLRVSAEDAGAVVLGALDVREAPRRPEAIQNVLQIAAADGGTIGATAAAASASAASASRLIRSFSSLPGLKYGTFFGGTSTLSPVFGLRPLRGSRLRRRKLPNPRSSIFSPRCSASMMLLNTVSTMTSECFLVRSETRETSSTNSAFVMLPPVMELLVGIRGRVRGQQSAGIRPGAGASP